MECAVPCDKLVSKNSAIVDLFCTCQVKAFIDSRASVAVALPIIACTTVLISGHRNTLLMKDVTLSPRVLRSCFLLWGRSRVNRHSGKSVIAAYELLINSGSLEV